jgi:ribosome-binding protein aMBF1 (putative translation factor)
MTVARKKLPRGWAEGSARDLLQLSDDEAAIVEMRVRLARKVREKRIAKGLTQQELAERMQSTQPRVARMEQAGASLELLIRALFALGANRKEIARLLAA